jgi:hypothetical protein
MPDRFPRGQISPMPEARLTFQEQRRKLAAFAKALGADPGALVRGADLNWHISGEAGDVRPLPRGYEIFLTCASREEWKDAKARLGFFVVKENGVSGLLWVAALPDRDQAAAILDLLGIASAWRGHAPKTPPRIEAGTGLR